jgi:hypothetical protein
MQTADVNWMLGAVVQSGAALVAIVGGLLGSRYVSLDAEQQAAQRRLDDAGRRLISARKQAQQAEQEVIDFRVRDIMDDWDVYEAIAKSSSAAKLDEVLEAATISDSGVPRGALEKYLQSLSREISQAFASLVDLVSYDDEHVSWDRFRRENPIHPQNDQVWEWVYTGLVDERVKEEREARKKSTSQLYGGLINLPDVPSMGARNFAGISAARSSGLRTATISRLMSSRDDSTRTRLQLEAEAESARIHVAEATQPEGFSLALSVLRYIAVTTIAVPICLMVIGPVTLPLWIRIIIAVLFLSGVALLLRFWLVYSVYLKQGSERRKLPNGFVGLLRRAPLG